MIRMLTLFSLMAYAALTMAQSWSVGGYLTPTYGNIVNKGKSYKPVYQPVFTIGGGLTVNYSKSRWMFNSGLNYKYPGASQQIPVTTVADPDGVSGATKAVKYFEHVLTIPLGCHYAIINKETFRFYAGLAIENGQILKRKLYITDKDFYKFDRRQHLQFAEGYYIGVMPELRADFNLSSRKFLFVNLGLSYQLNHSKIDVPAIVANMWPEKFRINNLFMDIGFAYRLKNE